MFGFNTKKPENKSPKKQNRLDKILMGVVLGGAIGSVLGIGMGSENRKLISKKANKLFNNAKDAVSDTAQRLIDDSARNKVKPKTPVMNSKELPEE